MSHTSWSSGSDASSDVLASPARLASASEQPRFSAHSPPKVSRGLEPAKRPAVQLYLEETLPGVGGKFLLFAHPDQRLGETESAILALLDKNADGALGEVLAATQERASVVLTGHSFGGASAVRVSQELFELRKKVKTRQQVKPHLFTHTKHRIGQLQTLLSQRAA